MKQIGKFLLNTIIIVMAGLWGSGLIGSQLIRATFDLDHLGDQRPVQVASDAR